MKSAEPYLLGFTDMTLPHGGFETVLIVGVERASGLGDAWNFVEGIAQSILQNDGIVVDVCEADKLDHPSVGELREVGRTRAAYRGADARHYEFPGDALRVHHVTIAH